MTVMATPTPEEKLFAVIQGASPSPLKPRSAPFSWRRAGSDFTRRLSALDLPRVNQALIVVAVVLGGLCVLQPLVFWPRVDRLLAEAPSPVAPTFVPPLQGLKPLEHYVEVVTAQDPFRIGEPPATGETAAATAPPPVDPRTLVADMKMVGISWSDQPVAMIEQRGQTFVVKQGETIGSAVVKDVQKDRVILTINGHDVELF